MEAARTIAILSLMSMAAIGAGARTVAGKCVTVDLRSDVLVPIVVLANAEGTAARVFGEIGISVRWRSSDSHPGQGGCLPIHLEFTSHAAAESRQNALASALPYANRGTQIRIFVGRVLCAPSASQEGALLGYVMLHEIGHMLEGVNRHSGEGIMKAHWTRHDLNEVFYGSLRFAGEDVDLIQGGFWKRMELVALR